MLCSAGSANKLYLINTGYQLVCYLVDGSDSGGLALRRYC